MLGEQSILPTSSTPWEEAVGKVSGDRWGLLDIDVIRDSKDPQRCPEHLLNFLAFERSVDVWDANWPVEKKRQVIADAPLDHRLKGTEEGIRRYVAHAGGKVERFVTQPQGLYGPEDWTPEQRQQFLDQLDEIRVHRYFAVDLDAVGVFAGDAFYDADYYDNGPSYHGYRKAAFLVRPDGTRIDLTMDWVTVRDEHGIGTEIETIYLPPEPEAGLFADYDFYDDAFIGRDTLPGRMIQRHANEPYRVSYQDPQFGVVFPGGNTILPIADLIIEPGFADDVGLFAGHDYYDDAFYRPDTGWMQIYERFWVDNPELRTGAIGEDAWFYDDAYYGWPDFRAEVTVELLGRQAATGAEEFFDHGFYLANDLSAYWRLLDAVSSAKALRDTIVVNTTTYRAPRFGDRLKFGSGLLFDDKIKDR